MWQNFADVAVNAKSPTRRAGKAPLIPLPIISEPFSRVAMDLIGPLPKSRSGHRYILVLCDYATRYPEAVPLRNIDAEHVAEELVKVISRVGIPREILSDQGSNFMSQLLTELYNLLHVKRIRTSPYHPQTDGVVERFNQTLKSMLRKFATDHNKDWDRLLPYLLFAYREVPQSSTGFSPFELLYGRAVRGPLDVLKETWETSSRSTESVVSYILLIRERLDQMTELVQENMAKAQQQQKRWYDKTARSREFEPGEKVLLLLPTSTNKLKAKWQGPYTVTKRLGTVNYEIDMKDKGKRFRVFHINLLRKWHMPVEAACSATQTEDPDGNDPHMLWRDEATIPEPITVGNGLYENNRLMRWSLSLQPYQLSIKPRPGMANGNADALSRIYSE